MQRSRRALLQRRAAAAVERKGNLGSKRLYYKVSLSLVLFLWGLIFLLNFLIGHGNGYRDEPDAEARECKFLEVHQDQIKSSHLGDALVEFNIVSDHPVQNNPISVGNSEGHNTDELAAEKDKANLSSFEKEQAVEEIFDSATQREKGTPQKSDRVTRVAPPGLDEFKSKAVAAKEKPLSNQRVVHRLEPGGKEYNYASAKKGAKVLEYNKEAKGAPNILDKDKDKYLRNACSVEDKYVVIELSEETLVDTIEIGNFEHYSSNLKDFELYSSLIYPTDNWVKLGNFTSQNVKHAQRFSLTEPKWARYLKLNMLSHYGAEFYCTLSVVEVYGVDVVEKMLEDLISVEAKRLEPEEQSTEQMPQQESTNGEDLHQEFDMEVKNGASETPKPRKEVPKSILPDPVIDVRPPQVGRIPGDAVLKILLQKVQSLDLNFSVLERYLEELNNRYAHIFKDFDDDISNKDLLIEKIRLEIKNLQNSKDIFAKEMGELQSWQYLVSSQLNQLAQDNTKLRSEFERVRAHQIDMEKRGLVVIFMSFVFGCIALAKLFMGIFLSIFRTQNFVKFCWTSSAWFLLLLSSSIIAFILVV